MISNNKIDFLANFYRTDHSNETFVDDVDSLFTTGFIKDVRVFPCFIEDEFINGLLNNDIPKIEVIKQANEILLCNHKYVEKKGESKTTKKEKFHILPSRSYRGVYCIVTFGDGYYFSHSLLPFCRKNHPSISLTFITHKRLQNLLTDFKSRYGLNMIITRASVKSIVEGKALSSLIWSKFSLEEAFK